LLGYGLGALTKPLFAVATSVGFVFTARLLDRVGKGIRGAPRDALIADITSSHMRGAAFGLRQSLDTVGAFIGPLLSVGDAAVGKQFPGRILGGSDSRLDVSSTAVHRPARTGTP
jgi:MFS family permease